MGAHGNRNGRTRPAMDQPHPLIGLPINALERIIQAGLRSRNPPSEPQSRRFAIGAYPRPARLFIETLPQMVATPRSAPADAHARTCHAREHDAVAPSTWLEDSPAAASGTGLETPQSKSRTARTVIVAHANEVACASSPYPKSLQ